jgi:paraquat-inducible protein A
LSYSSIDSEHFNAIPTTSAWRLQILLWVALVFFLVGISTPLITLSKFVVFENSFSVLGGIAELVKQGQWLLFLIICMFSIVFPLIKMVVLQLILSAKASNSTTIRTLLHWMHELGRWAMLDVMVVAILIVTVKLGAIASIEVHYGLYLFGTAVLLIMLVTHRVIKLTQFHQVEQHD